MRVEIANRVLMLGAEVAAEVPSSVETGRAWVLLGPNEHGGIMVVELVHLDTLSTDDYPAPEDVLSRTRSDFADLDSALQHLSGKGIDSDTFEVPWKTDFPF